MIIYAQSVGFTVPFNSLLMRFALKRTLKLMKQITFNSLLMRFTDTWIQVCCMGLSSFNSLLMRFIKCQPGGFEAVYRNFQFSFNEILAGSNTGDSPMPNIFQFSFNEILNSALPGSC